MRKAVSASRGASLREPSQAGSSMLALMLAWVALMVWAMWDGRLPVAASFVVAGLCVLTFVVYWFDKNAAQRGQWRTQEKTLHLLSALSGWPGAWVAQQVLRHKTRKATFK